MNNASGKMQIRESFAMAPDGGPVVGAYSESRGFFITRMALLTTVAIFSCLLVGTGLLIYQFASCQQDAPVHASICDHPSFHHYPSSSSNNVSWKHHLPDTTTDSSTSTTTSSTAASLSTTASNSGAVPQDVPDSSESPPSDQGNVRLPRSIEPVAYNIKLIPFIFENNFTFDGSVDIKVRVVEDCDNITLHAVALKIHDAQVWRQQSKDSENDLAAPMEQLGIEKQFIVESQQFFVLKLKRKLHAGDELSIVIKYTGFLNEYLQGFYRSSYNVRNETM